MDLRKLINRRAKASEKAKAKTISVSSTIGPRETLIEWLTEQQAVLHNLKGQAKITSHLYSALEELSMRLSGIDDSVSIKLLWREIDGEGHLDNLMLDGVEVVWSVRVADKLGQDSMVVDTAMLGLRELGIY